jgi:hypothetical protein
VSFSPLKKLFYLQRQFSRDSDIPFQTLHKRDRSIALKLAEREITKSDEQLDGWLSRLITDEDKALWSQIESGHRLIDFGMVIIGLLVGWLTVTGLFQYDGAGRVNLVYLLFVFVALQLALVLLAAIAMLPSSVSRWLPGFSSLQEMLKWFSPGRLQGFISRFKPKSEQSDIALLLGRNQKVFARIGKWQIFSWSQLFGVAFNVAALFTLFVLIAVKDIAFGWSTTLNIQTEAIFGATKLLSWPWQSWLPSEVPTLSLVEVSRYFRLQESIPTAVDAEILGGWWPFLMLCLFFYGLLPRLLLMLFCRAKLNNAVVRTIRYFPGKEALLDRLNRAVIETHADSVDAAAQLVNKDFKERGSVKNVALGSSMILINWSGFDLSDERLLELIQQAGRFSIQDSYQAGSNCQPEEDLQVIEEIAKSSVTAPIGLLVKSWEPPLGELADFIHDLRDSIAPERALILMPIRLEGNKLAEPEQRDIEEWQRFTNSLVDPWVSLSPLGLQLSDEDKNG